MTQYAPPAATPVADVPTPAQLDPSPAALAHAGRGKIVESRGGGIVAFQPRGTQYELHLAAGDDVTAKVSKPVKALVHVEARKVYTVPSGGNFVVPIVGATRIVQGRVIDLWEGGAHGTGQLLVQAGAMVLVELPEDASAIDLANGPIEQGALVNVVAHPEASLRLG